MTDHDRPQAAAERTELAKLIKDGPDVEASGLSAWTLADLCAHKAALGQDTASGWPVARGAQAGLLSGESQAGASAKPQGSSGRFPKRGLQAAVDAARAARPDKRLTLWFEDEARVGQKGRTCHRWWTRGQRPPGVCDRRYTWVHMMAAVQSATGKDFCLVMPEISTEVMNTFLAGFSATRAADEHALMVMHGTGWH